MAQTIKQVREEGLDKFYTIPSVVQTCLDRVSSLYNWSEWDMVIEPSAGNGSFLTRIPVANRIGLDLSPAHPEVHMQDFLTYEPPNKDGKRILLVGNPPFGRVSSLAVKFFNQAAKWATVIAFILPRTFRRISIQNRLNLQFHLVHDEEIPMEPCAFVPPMKAKCCFQIWQRQDTRRVAVELPIIHADWDFLDWGPLDTRGQPTPPTGAHFAIRAYGGHCGQIVTEGLADLRPKSWHWIRSNIDPVVLANRFHTLDYTRCVDTARQNSIGKKELVALYMAMFS